MNQKQVQPGSGAWSSLTYATHGKLQPERRSISISRLQGYGMREEAVLRLFRFAIRKNGDAANGLWLLDVARNQYHNLCQTASICNLGLEHFYAAFGLGCSRDLRTSSARAFGISVNDISEDCSVPSGLAKGLRPLTHGTPRETHIQKKAKIDPQAIEAQPLEEVKEESSALTLRTRLAHNHPAQLKLKILKVIWKVLKSTITLTFVGILPLWRWIFLSI